MLWPLFARAQRHWFLENLLLSAPGVQSVFFFCCAPLGQSKKKTPPRVFFFDPAPGKGRGRRSPVPARGRSKKKKHPGWCFFFCSGPVPARGFSFPCLSPGPEQKKKQPGWCFFFAAAPRGRSLTHCGPGWRCLPSPGWCFFCCGPTRTGVVFFFFFAVAPPGCSLTHCGLGRFRQGPGGVFFFLLRPRRVFLDNNKKCLGYYIGSKNTRRGHSKK